MKPTKREKFEEVATSHLNGQRTQAREQFKRLKKDERKECIKYLRDEYGAPADCIDFLIDNL